MTEYIHSSNLKKYATRYLVEAMTYLKRKEEKLYKLSKFGGETNYKVSS